MAGEGVLIQIPRVFYAREGLHPATTPGAIGGVIGYAVCPEGMWGGGDRVSTTYYSHLVQFADNLTNKMSKVI